MRERRAERGIWQRRYWEHLLRDEADFAAHMDYVHINPVKHGLVQRVADWPQSTFHRLVTKGVYPHDLAGSVCADGLAYRDCNHTAQYASLLTYMDSSQVASYLSFWRQGATAFVYPASN